MEASTPLWVPIVVAAVGVSGTVAAAWLTQRASKKREDERWRREREVDEIRWQRERADRLRELRIKLYVDLAEYSQNFEATLAAVTDELGITKSRGPEDLIHHEKLTAQVKLLAPKSVRDAWYQLRRSEENLRWELYEGSPNHTPQGSPYLDADSPFVIGIHRDLAELQFGLRAAMADPDLAE
ncbi:hypothetical protein ACH47V_23765 [Micromonospora chersina]|uniref:hypothetical protein n=1 Tax=Micromonospora chersina TaxID=47854 RepID=UPI0033DD658D